VPLAIAENVWDYPRPPRLEPVAVEVRVEFAGKVIALSQRAWRVLETSHPPTYYIPRADVVEGCLEPAKGGGASYCEWKGRSSYWDIVVGGRRADRAAWSYESPSRDFAPMQGAVAFYASQMDACYVDGEQVLPQPGGFYGGWITSNLIGPFKGAPGTAGW
jgi:uncharacterized protein (DUF427 family)